MHMTLDEIEKASAGLLLSKGFSPEEANIISQFATQATGEGHLAHGLGALWILDRQGRLLPGASEVSFQKVKNEGGELQSWLIDVGEDLGYMAGYQAARFLLELDAHPASVYIRSGGYRGRLGQLVRPLADAGYVAMAVQSTRAVVSPQKNRSKVLGTNPIAVGIPVEDGSPVIVDLATSDDTYTDWYVGTFLRQGALPDRDAVPNIMPIGGSRGWPLSLMVQLLGHCCAGVDLMPEDVWGLALFTLPVTQSIRVAEAKHWAHLMNIQHLPGQRSQAILSYSKANGVEVPEVLSAWLGTSGD